MKTLLLGPRLTKSRFVFYGNGVGGYTKNMATYIGLMRELIGDDLLLFHHSRRLKYIPLIIQFPLRFIYDTFAVIIMLVLYRPRVVMVLGQYRGAILREVAWVWLSSLAGVKVIYDVKAGKFLESLERSPLLYRFVLRHSDVIYSEGKDQIETLKRINENVKYLPNVVDVHYYAKANLTLTKPEQLNLVFVGNASKSKGIDVLIEALNEIKGIQLTLVGNIEGDIENSIACADFPIVRKGLCDAAEIRSVFSSSHVYIYPSLHPGEGHNNSINEALASGLIVISSKAGFLQQVLKDVGILLDSVSKEEIVKAISFVSDNWGDSRKIAEAGFIKCNSSFSLEFASKIFAQDIL